MFTKRMTITPAEATLWLDTKNSRNRPVSQSTVDRYTQEMKSGNWKFNGQTVIFDDSPHGGNLLNGQHRLKACVAANKPFETLVVWGIDAATFDTIDDGNKRSLADVFAIQGESCSGLLAAGVRFLHVYATGQVETRDLRRGKIATKKILEDTLAKHPGMRNSVKFINMIKQRNGGIMISAGMAIGLHYLFSLVDEVKADEFFTVFQSGLGLTENHPVAILRNRLISGSRDRSARLTDPAIYYYTVASWNSFQQNSQLRRLTFVPDSPPLEIENLPKKLMKDLL